MRRWLVGLVYFAVDEILESGRRLDLAARRDDPVDPRKADEVVMTLSEYVASLPSAIQAETARNLVTALGEVKKPVSTVTRRPRTASHRAGVARGGLLTGLPASEAKDGPNHRS